jgi:hypothetical protein
MAIVAKIECLDRVFSVSTRAGMIFLCVLYIEKDVNTGREEHQRSRQWLIEPSADETAVVDTAFEDYVARTSWVGDDVDDRKVIAFEAGYAAAVNRRAE